MPSKSPAIARVKTSTECGTNYHIDLRKIMAGVTGLEPAASGVTGRRSNQLSYTPGIKF